MEDVGQKFRLRAEQNGVWLRTSIPSTVPFVDADIGLLERVLENLIENAIAHAPLWPRGTRPGAEPRRDSH